ncbi:hypothetical protein HYV88_01495 [Candidatus Woesearchaeota archaeon]|nr:hypothetical protein [Candidatus Woesearchaeota archaeon]
MSKEKFIKIYSNLPLNLRREIITIIDKEPITWNVAYLEIRNNTELGKKVLKNLEDLKII